MLSNLLAVSGQVLVLFFLIGVGFILAKAGLAQDSAISTLSNFVLYISFPCTLIAAFQTERTAQTLHDLLLALALALGLSVLFFLLSHVLIRDSDPHRKRIFTLTSTIPNAGFMGFPLQTAIIGSQGVFLGSSYSMVVPLFMWTVGVVYLRGSLKHLNLKKAVLNPGVLAMVVCLGIFICEIRLPPLLNEAVDYLGALTLPLPMLVVGIQLAHTNLGRAVRDKTGWFAALLKLIVFPLVGFGLMYGLGVRGDVLLATTIAVTTPPGVIVAMFDSPESPLSAEVISLQTLCSMATMPVLVSFAQTFV